MRAPFTVHLSPDERRQLEAVRDREARRGITTPTLSTVARSLLVRACGAELADAKPSDPPRAA